LTTATGTAERSQRPPYRPPIGIPITDKSGDVGGSLASVVLHGLLILLIVLATRTPRPELILDNFATGAGGVNLPAGGGGGGTLGAGGEPTRPEFTYQLQLKAQPSLLPVPTPKVPPPEVPKPTPPRVEPPEVKMIEVKPPEVTVTPPVVEVKGIVSTVAGTIDTSARGTGGGSGNDGTLGNGPGRGGGIGSGDGTGTGSGTGPGTGGGRGNVYQPTIILTPFIPGAPDRVRPFELIAVFDVGADGNVLGFRFNRSGDRGYDRELEATLKLVRFRPAVDLQGRPVRASYQVSFGSK
jgi:hypothetical protein